jgi:hypothetical protein
MCKGKIDILRNALMINFQLFLLHHSPSPALIITIKQDNMDIEDDDWLHDSSAPNQGGVADPLTNVEYDRLASKYSDVGHPFWIHSLGD